MHARHIRENGVTYSGGEKNGPKDHPSQNNEIKMKEVTTAAIESQTQQQRSSEKKMHAYLM